MNSNFIHLRVHTEYSMVDGLCRIKPLIQSAVDNQMPAIAITDQNNICGLVKFYKTAVNAGVKPIVGSDVWIRTKETGDDLFRIVLLSMNQTGYLNLKQLISRAYTQNQQYGHPIIEKEWFVEKNEGLIVLSGGCYGDVGKAIVNNQMSLAYQQLEFWQRYFPERYYFELQRTGREHEEHYIHTVVDIAQQKDLPVVATNDVHFLKKDDFESHETRVCITQGRVLNDPRRPKEYSEQQYLRSKDEMVALFSDIPSAIINTVEIAKRCSVSIHLGEYFLPRFPTGDMNEADYLCQESQKGLEKRLQTILDKTHDDYDEQVKMYQARLQTELSVINEMGFPGYFLIVADFIQWAKQNKIPVGPGRGSGAGSLVAYAMDITDLDPLEYDLLFERFLNPERISMPDFDIDFCMQGRDKVIEYVADRYGKDSVSQIITFGTMAAKAVVRDVGRVMGKPYGFVDRLSKMIPFEIGMTLKKAFEQEESIREVYEEDEEVREIWDMALSLEGITRNAGKHAGGVVIAPSHLTDFTGLYCDENASGLVSQFDKDDVEEVGLVKFDFLGLKTLTIIDWAVKLANAEREKEGLAVLDIHDIPMDDMPTFKLLQQADTTAVFQLESHGMKELIKRLKPSSFEDIIALVALFRPGPLQSGMVDDFINRKHGKAEVAYPHPDYQHDSLRDILEPTYGVIVYQEQVMQIAQVLAGYSLGSADILRRAMGKKKPEEMAKQREIFRNGAVEKGVSSELAMNIFDLVEKFAGYGFNKSHSAAYALIAYQTAYLKAHYPAAFMAAVLSADMDNTDKVVTLVDDCLSHGLTLLPPDVNKGDYVFTVDNGSVVYGIGAIKGVGEAAIDNIVHERQLNGPYQDLFDFCRRVELKKVNRRVLEALIRSGAMDTLGPNRATLFESISEAIKTAEQSGRNQALGQNDLFSGALLGNEATGEPHWQKARNWSEEAILQGEKETLGLYLSGHPIDRYLPEIKSFIPRRIIDIQPTRRGEMVKAAGLIVGLRVMKTKKGIPFAMMTLDDRSGRMDIVLYSEAYDKYKAKLVKDKIIVVQGEVSHDDYSGGIRMSVSELKEFDEAREDYAQCLEIHLDETQIENHVGEALQQCFQPYIGGHLPVKVNYQSTQATARVTLPKEWSIHPTDDLIYQLKGITGCQNVALVY